MVTKLTGVESVELDLRKLTARDVSTLIKASAANDVDGVAAIYAKIVVSCPAEWGKPNDPETYLNLPFDYEFTELGKKIGEARKAVQGN